MEVLKGEAILESGNSMIKSHKWQGLSTSAKPCPEWKVSAGAGKEGVVLTLGGLREALRCQAKGFGL